MTALIVAQILSIVAVLFASITSLFAILAYCKVVGMEKSTHKIEYMNPEQMGNPTGKDLMEKMSGMYDEPEF